MILRLLPSVLTLLLAVSLPDGGQKMTVTLLYTNNTNGILENCGCPGNPMGGLDKRAALMRRLSGNNRSHFLFLDAGDILSSTGFKEKDQYVMRAYALLNYDAIGVGDQEFSNGTEFFAQLQQRGLPLISASLTSKNSKVHVVPHYVVKNIDGIRFGITSVVSEDPFTLLPDEKKAGIYVENPVSSLTNVIAELKEQCDLIILLSHLGYTRDRGIAVEFPDVDVIIGSHSQVMLKEPETIGSTVIAQAGKNAEHVGELKLEIDAQSKKIIQVVGRMHPLLKDLPGDSRIRSILSDYQSFVAHNFRDTCMGRPVPPDFVILENIVCMKCHEEYGYKWQLTGHAHAFKTIVNDGRINDPECLTCHTTGYCRRDGFTVISQTPHFRNVGCVECHFVKENHLEGLGESVEPVTADRCIRCHNEERDPHFDFESYVRRVDHRESFTREYIVRKGDNLTKIAKSVYQDPTRWRFIYLVNAQKITNPNLIREHQRLKLVVRKSSPEQE